MSVCKQRGVTEALVVVKALKRGETAGSLVVVSAVIRALDVDPPHSFNALSLFVLVDVVGTPCGAPCGLQQCIVRSTAILRLIEQDVEGLFIDASLWELNL